ncbi:hypothetical protein SUDANB15_07178 [Streptomyces sp. enrichment culture]|uniref:hypothetical protein n=1 Tax=Streptomyces sp. enrichment culture TaxID=1795815 RepID=UPI003F56928C
MENASAASFSASSLRPCPAHSHDTGLRTSTASGTGQDAVELNKLALVPTAGHALRLGPCADYLPHALDRYFSP